MSIFCEQSLYLSGGGITIFLDKRTSGPTWYHMVSEFFPWRVFLLDTAIPVLSYTVLANSGKPLAGIFIAGLWGIVRVVWKRARYKNISIFAVITVIFATVEFAAFYVSQNLYWLSLGLRSILYGILATTTLLLRKSFVEIMVEESKTTNFSEAFTRTKPYRNCWKIVTAIWSFAYILKGLYYIYLAPQLAIGVAFTLRAILGWPLDILLIIFSILFPHKYWQREYDKGNITMPITHKT